VRHGEEGVMTTFTDKVVANCLAEFARFKDGRGRETEDPFFKFVGEYWSFGLNNNNIDGRTTFQDSDGVPFRPAWSAAFISFIMRKSGAKDNFFYHEGHIHYVVKAVRDARSPAAGAKFLGRDPTAHAPKVGDLINAGRGAASGARFSNVLRRYGRNAVPNGSFLPTHSDIVVAVDQANRKLTTIGGNISNNVDKKTWDLKANGTLVKGPSLICVIECLL
jgi:hypothetical protein